MLEGLVHIWDESVFCEEEDFLNERNLSSRALNFSALRLFPESATQETEVSSLTGGESITGNPDEDGADVGGRRKLTDAGLWCIRTQNSGLQRKLASSGCNTNEQ